MIVKPYQSSGGESELRTYDGGEEARIEIQSNGFAMAWSSLKPLGSVLELVRPAIEGQRGKVSIANLEGEASSVSRQKVFDIVAADPEGWNCANFFLGHGEYVSWAMPLPEPPYLGEVGFATKNASSEWLRKLLRETAMPSIVEDLDGIFASVERLTHSTG